MNVETLVRMTILVMFILVVNLVVVILLNVRVTDASLSQLRVNSDIETNDDVTADQSSSSSRTRTGRQLETVKDPPSNDDCENAMIIPSTFPGLTYTTPGVTITGATHSEGRPTTLCATPKNRKDVWYQFRPTISSYYEFRINHIKDTRLEIYANNNNIDETYIPTTCQNAARIQIHYGRGECAKAIDSHLEQLIANRTYLIFVQPTSPNATGTLQLTVHRRTPPANNYCTNATIIDPTKQRKLIVNVKDMFGWSESIDNCYYQSEPTIWYKLTNPTITPLSVTATIDRFRYTFYEDSPIITIFRDNNDTCSTLQCGGPREISSQSFGRTATHGFVAEGLMTYYIMFRIGSVWRRNITIEVQPKFFSVINSRTDTSIQPLGPTIDYYDLPSTTSNLNLQANFDVPAKSVKSVRMTCDNPKRSYCDQRAPYTALGDLNGNYYGATIPLGANRITATPFTQSNCTGPIGATFEQRFTVTGCDTRYAFYFSRDQWFTLDPFISNKVSSIRGDTKNLSPLLLVCDMDIAADAQCGFPIKTIRLELRNGRTNELVLEHTYVSNVDAVLGRAKAHTDNMASGSYTIRAIVNNITQPAMNFTVVNDVECRPR